MFGDPNLPETNSEFTPEKQWLEDDFPFGRRLANFQGRSVSLWGR